MASKNSRTSTAAVTISELQIENTKRVKAVTIAPTASGLTVIGGKNNQGKTSVLDAIAYALGGEKYRPGNVKRDGSITDPYMRITLSNGLVVERKGKNSTLSVTDPSGKKAGQALLNEFVHQFALDLPRFLDASDKDKAKALLQIIGVGDQLVAYDREEDKAYNERTTIGQIAKSKQGAADQMTEWDGVPDAPLSAAEIIQQQQDIMARNAQRQLWINQSNSLRSQLTDNEQKQENLKASLRALEAQHAQLETAYTASQKTPAELKMESTEELAANLQQIEEINRKVNDNLAKAKAAEEARQYQAQYDELTRKIEQIREGRMNLLNNAAMPLPGLSVDHGALIYNGQPWDGMSSSEQLRVATAIVRKLNPGCGFVLLDKLEQMDTDTLTEFNTWLQAEGLQAIATRVSTGDECTIYIEDGYSVDHDGNRTAETEIKPADAFAPHEILPGQAYIPGQGWTAPTPEQTAELAGEIKPGTGKWVF